jgi:hypothetical protein
MAGALEPDPPSLRYGATSVHTGALCLCCAKVPTRPALADGRYGRHEMAYIKITEFTLFTNHSNHRATEAQRKVMNNEVTKEQRAAKTESAKRKRQIANGQNKGIYTIYTFYIFYFGKRRVNIQPRQAEA